MAKKLFKRILVTGGGGFIGSSYIESLLLSPGSSEILNIDSQTYACSKTTLASFKNYNNYSHIKLDICDFDKINKEISNFKPDLIVHFAAESHVDNSIENPNSFINTNIIGTVNLLHSLKKNNICKDVFFHHISTDEIYGDLSFDEDPFTEESPIKPSSPYSASKASADLMVRAWSRTYGINFLITNCSNNFGPRQHPEKLIPKTIFSLLNKQKIPIYGDGLNVRDWIYVQDHTNILLKLQDSGLKNQTFNIGSNNEVSNLNIVSFIIEDLRNLGVSIADEPIEFVKDRLGHDRRYAINNNRLENHISKNLLTPFRPALLKTVNWYLENQSWWNE